MADIQPNELRTIGTGKISAARKAYIPKSVMDLLAVQEGDELTYLQVLSPNYDNIVIIKKTQVIT